MSTRMVALGDSIYEGWGGDHQIPNDKRIPELIGKQLGWQCDNEAISGAKLAGLGEIDFLQVIQTLNFRNYDVCLICYGVNDFDWEQDCTLQDLRDALDRGVAKIRGDNPNIKVFYELPTATWRRVTKLTDPYQNGWSQKEMADALADECSKLGVPYYAWTNPLITYENQAQTMGDGQDGHGVHPSEDTDVQIAQVLAEWLGNLANGLVSLYINNISAIYQRIKQIQGRLQAIFMDDGTKIDLSITAPQANKLNQRVYLWTLESIEHLQDVVDVIVGLCNDYGIVDVKAGEATTTLHLWRPERLIIDDVYKQKLENNFRVCNELLDQLFKHMQSFSKEG